MPPHAEHRAWSGPTRARPPLAAPEVPGLALLLLFRCPFGIGMSLRELYVSVRAWGGYEAACRRRLWRRLHAAQPNTARRHYERFLLPLEKHEAKNGLRPLQKPNGKLDEPQTIDTIELPDSPLREATPTPAPAPATPATPDKRLRTPSPRSPKKETDGETGETILKDFSIISKPAEELNREFLDSLPKEENKMKISVKPVEKLIEEGKQEAKREPREGAVYSDLAHKLNLGNADTKFLNELASSQHELVSGGALSSLSNLVNGHGLPKDQSARPAGRSSLRAVRVKPARATPANPATPAQTPPGASLRPDSASSSPPAPAPVTNFGIHRPPAATSDDEIVEVSDKHYVPYKPKTPEIIDLDEYPESPQAVKKKKLDILKERGLEVTAIPTAPAWPTPPIAPLATPLASPLMLNPAVQHQIMTQAQIFQMYNIIPPNYANGVQPPKVIQATSAFGSSGPEKTVYGNPKDPFMPPPTQSPPTGQKPAVEIVRIPTVPSPSKNTSPQNLSKNYTLVDGKAVVGSNLEITLVNPKSTTPNKSKIPQKRSSNGKFVSAKTPTPPKEYPKFSSKKAPIVVPNYQVNPRDDVSPTSSTGSRDSQSNLQNNLLQNAFKGPSNLQHMMDMQKNASSMQFMDPMYMSALYSSLAGSMDQRQLAMYRDFMASQFRGYSGLLGVTPTTKN
ncbi:hypothetical protein MSG28_014798 [Choristoneura fumiferana]|uniref:Uncharacterized protein n=1 Tax=Choristoneura fumiferana TaxID=7141 RepID=A0ACC0JTC5_CHOFU|nr:hypothetical protein MSG28_014798 [Choristoneura fumiferana]